jgi:hypothetical protein
VGVWSENGKEVSASTYEGKNLHHSYRLRDGNNTSEEESEFELIDDWISKFQRWGNQLGLSTAPYCCRRLGGCVSESCFMPLIRRSGKRLDAMSVELL